ncbi:beta-N-acetylhexosaminidase OS=Streptomyces tendae OX=1932 GN=GUR47_08525 PE=3 SV=1 [Streptomyces tendae]
MAAVGAMTTGAAPDRRTAAEPTPLDRVIPAPASVDPGGAPYRITPGTHIRVDDSREARRVGDYLADLLRPSTGYRLPVTSHGHGGIRLRLAEGVGDEGYRLDSGRSGLTITARKAAGLFHGVQTLRQLLPAAVEKDSAQPGPWLVAGGTIEDTPRYAWRSAMLDVSRHFFGVDEVKRYIDRVALLQMDQAPPAPQRRPGSAHGHRLLAASGDLRRLHRGRRRTRRLLHQGGLQGDRPLRGPPPAWRSMPEIDMPGHTNAALASYAELNCDGVAPPLYTGTKVGFSTRCTWTRTSPTTSWTTSSANSPRSPPAATCTSAATRRTPRRRPTS